MYIDDIDVCETSGNLFRDYFTNKIILIIDRLSEY